MGTDIHTRVEIHGSDGKWVEVSIGNPYTGGNIEAYTERSYNLFNIIAGVRYSPYKTIGCARGIPTDVSDTVSRAYADAIEKYNAYGATWLTLAELISWYRNKKNFRQCDYDDADIDGDELKEIKREDKDVRRTFLKFIHGIWFLANQTQTFPFPYDVRVIMWFDC